MLETGRTRIVYSKVQLSHLFHTCNTFCSSISFIHIPYPVNNVSQQYRVRIYLSHISSTYMCCLDCTQRMSCRVYLVVSSIIIITVCKWHDTFC